MVSSNKYFSSIKDYSKENFVWSFFRNKEVNDMVNFLLEKGISNQLKNVNTIVDFGSGNGKYLSLFSKIFKSKDNISLDLSINMLKKQSFKCRVNGDIENIPLTINSSDLSICIGSLEFTNYIESINEIIRVTKDNGGVALFFPRRNIFYYLYEIYHLINGVSICSVKRYDVSRILEKEGFSTLVSRKCGYFGYFILAKRGK